MALTVGELRVILEARTAAFRRSLGRARAQAARFATRVSASVRRAGEAFVRIGSRIAALTGAVGLLGAALVGVFAARFTAGAVRAAATFESIGVGLEVLTGSAEGAAAVIEEVNRLVVQTPFGLEEVANAARSVAVVFADNTDAVAEFTRITADIAAATNRPIEQIGENLTRAFSAGLGAADVFREAGITQLILEQADATDVAQVSATDLAEALRGLTAEGGRLFGAAARQAQTLGGAISNTQIAFENFQRAFGEALSPTISNFLINTIQPAFQRLEAIVRSNEEAINRFAAGALPALLNGLRRLSGFVSTTLRALGRLVQVFRAFQVIGAGVQLVVIGLVESFQTSVSVIGNAGRILARVIAAIGLALTGRFAEARDSLVGIRDDISNVGDSLSASAANLVAGFDVIRDRIRDTAEAGDSLGNLADGIDNVAGSALDAAAGVGVNTDATEANTAAVNANTVANLDNVSALTRRNQAQRQALGQIERVIQAQTALAAGRTSDIQREIDSLDVQINKIGELSVANQDLASQQQALELLTARRLELVERIAQAETILPDVLADVNQQIADLARVDPEAAREFALQLQDALIAAGSDPTVAVAAAANIGQAIRDQAAAESGQFATDLTSAIGTGFNAALNEGLEGFLPTFANALQQSAAESLSSAFDEALSGLEAAFPSLGGGLGQAVTGVVGGAISAAFSSAPAIESASATVQSAITSAQQVRGVVAGPTQIGTADVGRTIQDAFIESERLLGLIARNTGRTADSVAGGGGVGFEDDAASRIEANQSASLV